MKNNIKLLVFTLIIIFRVTANLQANSSLIVFAASSTTNALDEIVSQFTQQTKVAAKISFASSSVLAKQIAAGAPANLFISAHPLWMDYLAERNLLAVDSRKDLLSNTIAVITLKKKAISVKLEQGFDFIGSFKGRLAMGDPTHVPAGIYGRQALESLGFWSKTAPRVVNALDTRIALAYVEKGECELGVVYQSDALTSSLVKILDVFPVDAHQPIVYPVAIIAENDSQNARDFLSFLTSEKAVGIFQRNGFKVPVSLR